ncbi:hypothetical protein GCK72_011189 [Caenorhabditis remanei]|uniref:Uncharacterized protein n=1 Tax=Caenorhabditis remanei TaxID=31234 RepID=A0A6A5H740_CAERE|nr:hypothetical protein GCK72_011189 [Caenorhabditis remanei]KAF1762925.1 hypothetical protein GCK72_011189 [Caenorhabditis remanei]
MSRKLVTLTEWQKRRTNINVLVDQMIEECFNVFLLQSEDEMREEERNRKMTAQNEKTFEATYKNRERVREIEREIKKLNRKCKKKKDSEGRHIERRKLRILKRELVKLESEFKEAVDRVRNET